MFNIWRIISENSIFDNVADCQANCYWRSCCNDRVVMKLVCFFLFRDFAWVRNDHALKFCFERLIALVGPHDFGNQYYPDHCQLQTQIWRFAKIWKYLRYYSAVFTFEDISSSFRKTTLYLTQKSIYYLRVLKNFLYILLSQAAACEGQVYDITSRAAHNEIHITFFLWVQILTTRKSQKFSC